MSNIEYLVTANTSIKLRNLGMYLFEYKNMQIADDIPRTLGEAAGAALDHFKDEEAIRVMKLDYNAMTMQDVTLDAIYFVAQNILDLRDDDSSIPDWARPVWESLDHEVEADYV